jgi:hypothetical protein
VLGFGRVLRWVEVLDRELVEMSKASTAARPRASAARSRRETSNLSSRSLPEWTSLSRASSAAMAAASKISASGDVSVGVSMGSHRDNGAQAICHRHRQQAGARIPIPRNGAETKIIANVHSNSDK